MGGATRGFYVEVVREALRILGESGRDHLVIGGVATRALFGESLDEEEDVDVLVREEDAGALLEAFAREGFATHRPHEEDWLYKAGRPDVTIDLIFREAEVIRLDDEHVARARDAKLEELELRVPAPEDLALMKAVFDAQDRRGRWYGAVEILQRFPTDWDYVVRRGREYAPKKVLAVLLYASEEGVDIPQSALKELADAVLDESS